MSRQAQRADVRALQALGLSKAAIARLTGVPRSTVYGWTDPEHAAKQQARRQRYRQPCPRCGRLMDGSMGRGPRAPQLCHLCSPARQHEQRYWNQERCIEGIQRYARRHGRPPYSSEWLGKRPLEYPATNTVLREFGSWANALVAAGFPRPRIGGYPRNAEKGMGFRQQLLLELLATHGPCTIRQLVGLSQIDHQRNPVGNTYGCLVSLEQRGLVERNRSGRGNRREPQVWSLCD